MKRSLTVLALFVASCSAPAPIIPIIPSLEYSKSLKQQLRKPDSENVNSKYLVMNDENSVRAHFHYVAQQNNPDEIVTNAAGFEIEESAMADRRDYNGALSLGDPGVTASLWRESRGANDIFRDQRAWQPLDLITVVVSESAEGSKEADTEITTESAVQAAIEQLFTIDDDLVESNPNGRVVPGNLINASTQNEFKGEGETTRRGSLKAKISAMVAEVLPSGILRIEGQKIISVNSEEQVMVISGLVRPRDINSSNEVDSSKIANMRIDYYGKGIVGEAQFGGWLGRIMRVIWPF